ncbi:MAG: zinc metalloprotease HtpX, partial [Phycisphaeraceae bacterium]
MTRFWNNTKTALLLGAMFGLILLIGSYWGTGGVIIAFLLGGIGNLIAFFFSDKIAIAAMRGQEVDEQSAPDLVHMVRQLANNAGLPMPRVYICPQQAPNAFATGRNPQHAAVAVTQGALRLLTYEEMEGVMAHELAHVKNRDTLISTVAATIAGALNALVWVFLFMPIGGSDSRGGNPLVMLLMVILAPIAAAMIQMAISRSREYVADADGARIAGSPNGLIAALQKLESANERIPMAHEAPTQNHMFIVQPLSATGGGLSKLFSTHPSTA